MTDLVSVGDLTTAPAMARRAGWMERFDVGLPPAPHPAPLVPGRPITTGDSCPGAVPSLVLAADRAGWRVLVIYSRGTVMHATGKPGALAEVVSVRCWRFPGQRAVLTWERPDRGDWSAGDGWVWQVGQPPVNYGVEQAKSWVGKGVVPVRVSDRSPADKGACQECGNLISLNKDGTLRVHGPKDARCHGGKRLPVAT